MKINALLSLVASGLFAVCSSAIAGPVKTYQVTGPVLEANDSMIVVQKGKERWEIARDSSTKGANEAKVGDKVTITYTMTAAEVESKAAAKADKSSAKAAASPAKK